MLRSMRAALSMLWENVRMSVNNIAQNRLRSALTVLGILIGVTAVIALLCLALGYLAARAIDKKLRRRPRWKTAVVNVYPMNKNK